MNKSEVLWKHRGRKIRFCLRGEKKASCREMALGWAGRQSRPLPPPPRAGGREEAKQGSNGTTAGTCQEGKLLLHNRVDEVDEQLLDSSLLRGCPQPYRPGNGRSPHTHRDRQGARKLQVDGISGTESSSGSSFAETQVAGEVNLGAKCR